MTRKETLSDLALLLLRVSVGVHMAWLHGYDKLRNFSARAGSFPDPLDIGQRNSLIATVIAEFFCAILLAAGLMGRVAALAMAFIVGTTVFVQRAGDPWQRKELSVLYLAALLALVLLGPGRLSLDRLIGPRFGRRSSAPGRLPVPAAR